MVFKKLYILVLASVFALNACSTGTGLTGGSYSQSSAIKGKNGLYKIGNPYKILGKWYYPKEDYSYTETGVASWYGADFHAKYTANGEVYDMNTLTAAHRTLPLPSIVKVTNLSNGRSLILRVNDRGPFAKDRIIDVSKRGAQLLGYQGQGTTKVKVELLEKESKELKMALIGNQPEPVFAIHKNQDVVASKPIPKIAYIPQIEVKEEKSSSGKVYVQAGAFNSVDSARNLKDKLTNIGKTEVFPAEINGGRFYRVRLGPFSGEKEAHNVLDKVKDFGVYNAKIVQD